MNNTYYIYISAAGRKQQRETAGPITHERFGLSVQRAYGLLPSAAAPPAAAPPAAPPAGSDSSDHPDPPSAGAVAANGKRKKLKYYEHK